MKHREPSARVLGIGALPRDDDIDRHRALTDRVVHAIDSCIACQVRVA